MLGNLLIYTVVESGKNVQYFDSVLEALLYALIGVAVTFLGIIILIGIVWAVGKITKKAEGYVAEKSKDKAKSENAPAENAEDEIGEAERVAIVAAIAAYYESENSTCEFKVKRIKRII